MGREKTNDNIEVRLIITPDDDLYPAFIGTKTEFSLRNNTETARLLLKKGFYWLKHLQEIEKRDVTNTK